MKRGSRQPSLFDPSSAAARISEAFDPARLTQARLLAGMTKQELSAEVGVSAAAIGQYEAGVIQPRPDTLDRLGGVLSVPLRFFAIGRPNAHLDATGAHFRSLRSTRLKDRQRAVAFAGQVWELANALEECIEFPEANIPTVDDVATPESLAAAIRTQWRIERGPVQHLVRTLEMNGIVVALLPFARSDSAASVDAFSTSRPPRPVIVLTPDRADDVYRHRFTAAHELGHLIMHQDAVHNDAAQEREADRFAAAFLTPRADIEPELPARLNTRLLEPLSRRWGVSIESLILRYRETESASDATVRRAHQRLAQARAAGVVRTESTHNYPGEVPTLLQSAFAMAEEYGTTAKDLAESLAWSVSHVREMLGQQPQRPALHLAPPVE